MISVCGAQGGNRKVCRHVAALQPQARWGCVMFACVCRRCVSDAVPQPTAGICKP